MDANVACTAQTMYSGTLGVTGNSFTGGYRLRENRNGVSIQTLNLHGTYSYANATDFTNTSTNWTSGSWTNIAQDQQALDVHWGAEKVLDYWRIVQNRNSLDDDGIRILSYVHAGSNWNNAQWVGGSNNHFMQYGDGDGITFNPLTALDVCGHELGHGIAEFTAGFHSTSGTEECDALNEGFSDIWGACIEHWTAPTKQTWLTGEEIFATPAFTCLRNLQNPNSTTAAEGQHPDTYHGDFWDNNGEPHTNSTVLSHWFYLLSQGGNGTNDLGNSYSINGIGISKAQLIAFQGETMLTSGATYANARNMTIEAAIEIYGWRSCEARAVNNAWYAVGIGTAPADIYTIGDRAFCTSATYSLSYIDGGTVTWSVSPRGVVSLSPSGDEVTVTKISNGDATLTATLHTSCFDKTFSKSISTQPKITSIDAVDHGCYNGYESWLLTAHSNFDNTSNWQWTVDNLNSGNWYIYTPNSPTTWVDVQGGGGISVSYQDPCGETSLQNGVTIWGTCNYLISIISPNPAKNMITITNEQPVHQYSKTLKQSSSTVKNINYIRQVKIYDASGKLQIQQTFSGDKAQIQMDVSKLSPGIYFVKISDGIRTEQQKLMIQ